MTVAAPTAPAEDTVIDKQPRTARGRRTSRALLDAAAIEFGSLGFHDASIAGITRRAGVAMGSFYTWFDSKDAIFRAVVRDLSGQVREAVAPAVLAAPDGLAAEQAGLESFLGFVRSHKELYRIIDEAEFVDAESFRLHYQDVADRIAARLKAAAARGEVRADVSDVHAWAVMGMNVFLGLRYAIWSDESANDVAAIAGDFVKRGLSRE